MPDPQDNRESRISDPMVPLYRQVAEAQREWHNAQNTIAGLKGAQEVITAQNHELRDENNRLRSQIAKAGKSDFINEGGAKRRRQTETPLEPPQGRGHGRGLVSEIVEIHNYQLSVPVDENVGDEQALQEFSRLCDPGPNNRYLAENLLRFAHHGKINKFYCFKEVCEKNDLTVTTIPLITSSCAVHTSECKIAVKRLNDGLGYKVTFRGFKEPAQAAHEPRRSV